MDRPTLEKVAQLARIELTENEAVELTQQLKNALGHFEQIAKVSTEGVEPLVTPSDFTAIWREDVIQVELTAAEVTANAPSKQGNLFCVPPVV